MIIKILLIIGLFMLIISIYINYIKIVYKCVDEIEYKYIPIKYIKKNDKSEQSVSSIYYDVFNTYSPFLNKIYNII